jgi:glycosyltransferase involved in cell wall biosynthesis
MSATKRLRNNNALLYKEWDAIDLAEKIHMLYKDRTATKEIGNRGRELVEKELSWNYISKLYQK